MGLVLLLIIAYPFIELYALVKVADAVGVFTAVLGLIALSFLGSAVIKSSGLRAWRKLNEEIAKGNDPSARLIDGVVVLLAGFLLLVPGYVTGAFGLLLLLPPCRALLRGAVSRRAKRMNGRFTVTSYERGVVIDADSVEVRGELDDPSDEGNK